MKRRRFLQGLTAAASLPALPLPAATVFGGATGAAGASGAAAATGVAGAQTYLWAEFVARVHDRASPAMLERLLKIDAGTARRVYGELLRDNIITAPDAFGLSRATNPYPNARVMAGGQVSARAGPRPRPERSADTRALQEKLPDRAPRGNEDERADASSCAEHSNKVPEPETTPDDAPDQTTA